jgi:hypothetical protein
MIQVELRILILFGAVFLLVYLGWLIVMSIFARDNTREKIKEAIDKEEHRLENLRSGTLLAKDLLGAYMNIVCKHGPDSMEAKAFLFGTDSPLLRNLHGDNEALEEFNRQVNIVNETYLRTKGKA